MRKTLMPLLLAAGFGLAGFAGAAASQTAAAAPDSAVPDLRELNRKVDAEYRAARTHCQSLARAQRRDCMREARAVRQETRAEVNSNHPHAALQVQSAQVSATGIAPSTGVPSPSPAAEPMAQ